MGKIFLLVLFCIATKAFAVESSLILEEQFPKKLSDFSFFKDEDNEHIVYVLKQA